MDIILQCCIIIIVVRHWADSATTISTNYTEEYIDVTKTWWGRYVSESCLSKRPLYFISVI